MNNAASSVEKIKTWFVALKKREQRLILGTLFAAPLFLFIQLGYLPNHHQQAKLETQIHQLEQDNTLVQSQVLEMSLLTQKDPDAENRQRLEQLQQEIARFDDMLRHNLSGLVAPGEMAGMLKTVLKQRPGLLLVKMENQPSKAITLVPPSQSGEVPKDVLPEPVLYQHPLHLELQGAYLDVLAYLHDLQRLPQRVFWQGMQIEMGERYPQAQIQIDVYTLSLEEGWIGG